MSLSNSKSLTKSFDHYFTNQTVAFKNCVYDFKTKVFYDPNNRSYINTLYNISEKPINKLLSEMISDKEKCEQFKTMLAESILSARNKKPIVEIKGDGGCGKTFLKEILYGAFDSDNGHCVKATADLLQMYQDDGENNSLNDSTCDTLHQCKVARIIMIDDLEDDKQINTATLKLITGDDTFYTKNTFGESLTFKLSSPVVMLFNMNVTINSNDPGFKRRHVQFNLNSSKNKSYSMSDMDMLSKSMVTMLINKCNEIVNQTLNG